MAVRGTKMVCSSSPILALRGICKHFPGVQALDSVDFEVKSGEVHALVGENGAGKSTLMHILSGVYQPDQGDIDFDGKAGVTFADEQAAQHAGVSIVFQERSLFDQLSVAENIFAGRQPVGRFGFVDHLAMWEQTTQLLKRVGLSVDPRLPVDRLSPHEQQLVEVAKALSLDARLILFDEPTAALTETETVNLFKLIKQLQEQKAAIIYISHRLDEIFQIADRVTVLKDGRWQATLAVSNTSPQELIAQMVGRELQQADFVHSEPQVTKAPVLKVSGLSDASDNAVNGVRLQDINFSVHRGEVLVLAGLAGAGRSETAMALFGARPKVKGAVALNGKSISLSSISETISAGIGYMPEDRKEAGLFLEKSIADNIAAASLKQFGRFWTQDRQITKVADGYRRDLNIASYDSEQPVINLSGGNQQKVLLAKWLLVAPQVLIVDEPTRGVDVGAKAEIHRLLHELAGQGTAVIVISSDLPEVLSVANRILVMAGGRIAGELSAAAATEEQILHLASKINKG